MAPTVECIRLKSVIQIIIQCRDHLPHLVPAGAWAAHICLTLPAGLGGRESFTGILLIVNFESQGRCNYA